MSTLESSPAETSHLLPLPPQTSPTNLASASPPTADLPASTFIAPGQFDSKSPGRRRPNGKIPHLPVEHIERINHLLDQGCPYREILAQMAATGVSLTYNNLSRWYHGGYQDHLKTLEARRQVLLLQERLLQFAASGKGPTLTNVSLQVSVTRLAHMILELAPAPHIQTFQSDAREYLRLVNTLGRLGQYQLAVQQYEDQRAATQAANLPPRDPSRELTDQEMDLVASNIDKVFRRHRPSRPFSASSRFVQTAPDDVGL